jgi:hypothetical protein
MDGVVVAVSKPGAKKKTKNPSAGNERINSILVVVWYKYALPSAHTS